MKGMTKGIRKIEKETFSEAKGFRPWIKKSWWWNVSVQEMVRIKMELYKASPLCKNEEN